MWSKRELIEWETPDFIMKKYKDRYELKLDVCATKTNAKLPSFFTKEDDAFSKKWNTNFFMNPPLDNKKQLYEWVRAAHLNQEEFDVNAVLLLPAWTDSKWFHEFLVKKTKLIFLKGRLRWQDKVLPYPSMVSIYESSKQ